MNILFIAPRLPYPADTGAKIRTYNNLKQIARNHSVDLVCFSFDKKDSRHKKTLAETLGIRAHMVDMPAANILVMALRVIFSRQAITTKKYFLHPMSEALMKISVENKFDLVHVDHIHMANYLTLFPGIPCVIDEHNVEYRILERFSRLNSSVLKRVVYSWQADKMRTFERAMIRRAGHCLAVSSDDKTLLANLAGKDITVDVIANGVDTDFFDNDHLPVANEETLVFTGSMDWVPNDDAMIYFCSNILPLIWKVKPEVRIYIVGRNPNVRLRALAGRDQRIFVTGAVDDVRVYMRKAKVFVVPIRVGGGTRLKILEAMSMQMAVVSTSIGAEGIKFTNGQDISIADQPQAFADAVLTLLNHSDVRQQMGVAARDLVRTTYDWSIIGDQLENVYQKLITARRSQ